MGMAIKNRIFRIWGNSRLVKQNDRCIFKQCTRNRDPLALSSRQGASVFTKKYLIAVRHFTDKFITAMYGMRLLKKTYGYARVSSRDQHLDRQIKALLDCGVAEALFTLWRVYGRYYDCSSLLTRHLYR